MRKFEVTVIREDKYIIEIDESKFNEQWMDDWRNVFYDFYSLEEHAEHLAQHRARFKDSFIEGYGAPLVNGRRPIFVEESQVEKGINIKTVSEDDNIETQVDEVE